MILTDGTEGGKDLNIYKKVDEVDFQNWTEQNYNYLKLVFAGAPSTVITIRRAENAEGYNAELKKLKDLKWNYLTIPGLGSTDTTTISAWIKQYRDDERKRKTELRKRKCFIAVSLSGRRSAISGSGNHFF